MCNGPIGFAWRRVAAVLAFGIVTATGSGGSDTNSPIGTPPRVMAPEKASALALESRISDMGPDGDGAFDATQPAVAYNATENEFLVVWEGDDHVDGLVDGEIEIHAQFIDALTEAQVGADDFRVSHMGPDGDVSFGGFRPAVAYNGTDNQYLVVWHGDDGSDGLADEEFEIWGQLLDAGGAAIGSAIRISAMGDDGDPAQIARNAQVAYNGVSNEYLVVWEGVDNVGPLGPDEFEIFGQLIDASGAEIGPDDFRISDMGPNGHPGYDAFNAAVAHNHLAEEYLVVWDGDDNTGGVVANEFEIRGQLVAATTGIEIGVIDFRISVTGPDGAAQFDATEPSVAFDGAAAEYLVVWVADGAPLPDNKLAIRGQRIDAAGNRLEPNDLLIGSMGDPGDADLDAEAPSVAHNALESTWLVVWHGDDTSGGLVDDELEVYGRLVTFPMTGGQFRVSDMGTEDGDDRFDARLPVVAYNDANDEFLVVWEGDDDTGELIDDEQEIYGQKVAADTTETGANDFRISSAGPDGDFLFDAARAEVAYNVVDQEYLVVWVGEDDIDPLVEGELEIFGQRIDAVTGAEVGANDFRISQMGPDGDAGFEAGEPAIAYSRLSNRYLVVWEGDDASGNMVDDEFEIWGQLIDGATGAGDRVGIPDQRLRPRRGPLQRRPSAGRRVRLHHRQVPGRLGSRRHRHRDPQPQERDLRAAHRCRDGGGGRPQRLPDQRHGPAGRCGARWPGTVDRIQSPLPRVPRRLARR